MIWHQFRRNHVFWLGTVQPTMNERCGITGRYSSPGKITAAKVQVHNE